MIHTTLNRCFASSEPSATCSSIRKFSASSCRKGHYQTLSVPKNATRNQIKSSYYKLTKLYHPDVAAEPGAKERFQAVSEAYAVLGDDRKRRAYDRSLEENQQSRQHHAQAHHSTYSSHWSYETQRRRGATYAWDRHPRRPAGTSYRQPPGSGSAYQPPHARDDPFVSPNVQRATGRRGSSRMQEGPSDADRVSGESGFWRTVQVIGVVLTVAAIGGGFSANAG
ncbi:hypothetical protein IEO21_06067 [Rhodonia placenta]|uniref:J domain-containing protein n=1 Tax=Rhodonia placenta TaxID=104341 RepID=A0A8H7U1N7_9APHY|nr:hypothetical protein IEO21_06067 [Postia placenta]